jgi:hypothetical protein
VAWADIVRRKSCLGLRIRNLSAFQNTWMKNFLGCEDLQSWLDRPVHHNTIYKPSLCPVAFPSVVTSRSLNNLGGGLLNEKQTKRQVKIDAIERALEELEQGAVDEVQVEVEVAKRLAAAVRLKKLNAY